MRPFVFTLIAVALVAIAIGAGGAIAQEDAANETDSSVMFDLDDDVRVLDIDYESDGGVLEVTVENSGDTSETVHLVEIVERGAESWGWVSPRIRAGETTTIRLEGVEDRGGKEAALIATETGLENQRVEWISTGGSPWFNGPATWGLMGVGAIATGGGTFWGVRKFLKKREKGQEERQVEVIR